MGGGGDRRYRDRFVTEVSVRSGILVDGIRVVYSDRTVCDHGGGGGGDNTFALSPGEYIDEILVKYGKYVKCLTFRTSLGRTLGPCGGDGSLLYGGIKSKEVTLQAPDGLGARFMLAGFHGGCGKYVDSIGAHWTPVTQTFEARSMGDLTLDIKRRRMLKTTEVCGGYGGSSFDDGHYNIRITEVVISTLKGTGAAGGGGQVRSIQVRYYNGKEVIYGGARNNLIKGLMKKSLVGGEKEGSESHSLSMEAGEYVIEALVQYTGDSVIGLSLITNKGRMVGPPVIGNDDGGAGLFENENDKPEVRILKAPENYMLIGIKGRAGSRLDAIGFNWSPAPNTKDGST